MSKTPPVQPAQPVRHVARSAWRGAVLPAGERAVPEETAIAFTYNGSAHAVMMATPLDLEDFARGFSLTEGMVASAGQIETIETIEFDEGIELRIWIDEARMGALRERNRRMAGPTGCGLCGVESLAEAVRPVRRLNSQARFTPHDVLAALAGLESGQTLHRETRAVHAAGLWTGDAGAVAIREDVGRHNALDKLIGAMAGAELAGAEMAGGENLAARGILVLSSRISVEMVQKAAVFAVPVIVAVSAPTALAIRTAEAAGITLAAVARHDGFEVFTHPERIVLTVPEPAL